MRSLCLAIVLFSSSAALGAEHRVGSAVEIAKLAPAPGDVIVLNDGEWKDQKIKFSVKGTAQQPITLRAATAGKVVLAGESFLEIEGEHLVVSGLSFNDCSATNSAITVKASHTRITECSVTGGKHKFHVHIFGKKNRLDHCYLAGKTNEGPTLQIDTNDAPNEHLIDHNHFGPRPPLRQNGGETIRIGYSHQQKNNSRTVVEHNLFDKCDGEIEIISSKSCENIYRWNSFIECAGMLTLRHGDRCTIDGK